METGHSENGELIINDMNTMYSVYYYTTPSHNVWWKQDSMEGKIATKEILNL